MGSTMNHLAEFIPFLKAAIALLPFLTLWRLY